jgi:hypothetical protein
MMWNNAVSSQANSSAEEYLAETEDIEYAGFQIQLPYLFLPKLVKLSPRDHLSIGKPADSKLLTTDHLDCAMRNVPLPNVLHT